jgi:signal transduction histidine kinase
LIFDFISDSLIPARRIQAICFDHDNHLWFEDTDHLYNYDGTKTTSFPHSDREFEPRISCIKETPDSTIVVATSGTGLRFLKHGKIINRLTKKDGLCSNQVRNIFIQGETIYVATKHGFSYFTYKNNEVGNLKSFTTGEGILSNDINDISSKGNKIYLASNAGLCIVDKNYEEPKSTTPHIYITSVSSGDSTIVKRTGVVLPFHSDLVIDFIAPTFNQPEKVEYQYNLTSSDNNWIATKNASITLSSIAPGRHHFRVRAKKFNSGWSAPALFSFEIKPAFYRQWWFQGIMLIFLVTLIFFVIRIYTARRYRKQLELLKQKQVIAAERDRIAADMHDDIGADLSNLLMLTRLAHRTSEVSERERTMLQKIEDHTSGVIQKVGEIIWALNPTDDTLDVLVSFLHDYFNELLNIELIEKNFLVKGIIPQQSITASFRRNIFLVVKELINNILKHALSSEITMEIEMRNSNLMISIRDNGKGFDFSQLPIRGNGLRNIKKRISEMNGKLTVKSDSSVGTEVFIEVPVLHNYPFG